MSANPLYDPSSNSSINKTTYFLEPDNPPIWEDHSFLFITSIIWVTISVIGILANMCVILVMFCSSTKKSATHYFITNLAFSDMFFLLISPTLAILNLNNSINFNQMPHFLGKLICKADYYLSHVC